MHCRLFSSHSSFRGQKCFIVLACKVLPFFLSFLLFFWLVCFFFFL
uniref:Uncharacterized protein n=1 Tax=Anguilla anguilla TaxID=7936 RepID=A0A0E9ULV1_ANGAN